MRKLFNALALAAVAVSLASPASAQTPLRFGGQVSFADDFDLGVGVRVKADTPRLIAGAPLSIVGSFDFYFPGNNVTYMELNGNVLYNFTLASSPLRPYAGGGLNFARASIDFPAPIGNQSSSDVGLNLVGGLNFRAARLAPFVEIKFELGGGEQLVLSGGLYF